MVVGGRVVAKTGQRLVNAVTTNVPGPQQPLYLLGRRMREVFPYVPIAEGVRISIGIATYNGRVAFGITGDYDAVPDLDVLCGGDRGVPRRAGRRGRPATAAADAPPPSGRGRRGQVRPGASRPDGATPWTCASRGSSTSPIGMGTRKVAHR